MLQLLSKLTGFNEDFFSHSEIIKEANRKFGDTWLIINGEPKYVISFEGDYIRLTTGDGQTMLPQELVQSIEPWMPEPGIYQTGNGYIYLHRLPRRQWLKSFSLGNNYSYQVIMDFNELEVPDMYHYWKEREESSQDWIFIQRFIIYKFHVVGYCSNLATITVTDEAFYSEVFDKWHKHYKIIVGKQHQDPAADASSNTLS